MPCTKNLDSILIVLMNHKVKRGGKKEARGCKKKWVASTHMHVREKKGKKTLTCLLQFTHMYYKCVKKAFLHASIMNKGVSRRAEDEAGVGSGDKE